MFNLRSLRRSLGVRLLCPVKDKVPLEKFDSGLIQRLMRHQFAGRGMAGMLTRKKLDREERKWWNHNFCQ